MLNRYFIRPTTVDRIRASWIGDAIERYVSQFGCASRGEVRRRSPSGCSLVVEAVFRRRVGGHLYGRFCRIAAPTTWRTNRDARSPEICSSGFAANVGRSLNAPQRPSQPSQRDNLLFLFSFAQDIAHVTGA